MIVKAINEDIQRVSMTYIECLNIKIQRSMMYGLNHALYKYENEKKMTFEALALKPKYLRFIGMKEKEYGSALLWSSELINKVDNEFIQKYM